MPIKGGRLTDQEKAYAMARSEFGSTALAGAMAGYANHSSAWKAEQRSEVQAEIKAVQVARLTNELLPLALDTIRTALTDNGVPWGAKMQASKIVVDRAFEGEAGAGKDPSTMTADELAQAIEKMRAQLADRAKPIVDVDPTPADDAFG